MKREPLTSVLGRIVADESVPEGTLYAISPRRQVLGLNGYEPESIEDWAKRCFYIVNIGEAPTKKDCGSHRRDDWATKGVTVIESDYDQKAVDVIKNLSMLVRRLCYKHANTKLVDQALGYLRGEGLQGCILQSDDLIPGDQYLCPTCNRWHKAVTKLLEYIEAHDWGTIPEPHDSVREVYVLLGKEGTKELGGGE